MKVSVVPAQITTVEDRIAGNLSFTQILLLSIPQFFVAILFVLIPPVGHFSILKLVISLVIIGCSSTLAIRINNKILLDLLKLRISYFVRPHIYVYKKQTQLLDVEYQPLVYKAKVQKTANIVRTELTSPAKNRSYKLLSSSSYSVLFKTKEGGLSVEVTSVE